MTLLSGLGDMLFPSACVDCRAHLTGGALICTSCEARVSVRETLLCGRCGARLPDGRRICHRAWPYALAAAADYRDPVVRTLVRELKFRSARPAAAALGRLMARHLALSAPPSPDHILVPVPLGRKREKMRGFNQAKLLADVLSEQYLLPVADGALARTRETAEQSKLHGIDARRENIRGAFAVPDAATIRGRRVILVDDVCTSGSTLAEAAQALKSAGARQIIAAVAARA